jgi:hypothetical protein
MNWWSDPHWWVQAVVAFGTLLAVIVALFAEPLKRWLCPPEFILGLKSDSGELTPVTIQDPNTGKTRSEQARYYHLSVKNSGWSTAKNTAVYVTHIMLRGAGGIWYQAWSGETPLTWRHSELYPLMREIGTTPVDADLFSLVRNKWLELCVVVRPNALPTDMPNDLPGRWREKIDMVVTVQVKSTDAQSVPKLFHVVWDGSWQDGDAEIVRHLRIRPISDISET